MVAITGATGLVGSHVVAEWLRNTAEPIKLLVRKKADRSALLTLLRHQQLSPERLMFVEADLRDSVSLVGALYGCQTLIHAAALVSFKRAHTQQLYEMNAGGTANLVNAAIECGVRQLIYISSTATIGDVPINGLLTESSEWTTDRGKSAYSLSKRLAEFEVERGRQEGIKAAILCPAVVIGTGAWGRSSTAIVKQCSSGMRFSPPGANAFVDARDVARFAFHAASHQLWEGRYLLLAANLKFHDFFSQLTSAFGASSPKIVVPRAIMQTLGAMATAAEWAGINLPVTAENFKSGIRSPIYSNQRAVESGFQFTSLSETVGHVVTEFNRVSTL